jgi:hypothetical protein
MGRGPATFKQTDLTRALRAAQRAGFEVGSFEIDRAGKIVVHTSHSQKTNEVDGPDDWNKI